MKHDSCGVTPLQPEDEAFINSAAIDLGWYLYGVLRRDDQLEGALTGVQGVDMSQPLQAIIHREIAAIVSLVSLAEFGAEGFRSRMKDLECLEAMIRSHNRVVEHAFRTAAILPAKLGCVYMSGEDIEAALARSHDALVSHLDRVRDCDEWGVRLYATRSLVQRRLAGENSMLRQLQQEAAVAGPGRAYFLKSKIADVLSAATDQSLADLAQIGYDFLINLAVAGEVSSQTDGPPSSDTETEILRAAFLVCRRSATDFVAEVQRFCEDHGDLRCEYSGPWAPYSFASLSEEV